MLRGEFVDDLSVNVDGRQLGLFEADVDTDVVVNLADLDCLQPGEKRGQPVKVQLRPFLERMIVTFVAVEVPVAISKAIESTEGDPLTPASHL